MEENQKPKKTSEAFVSYVTSKLAWDKSFSAKLKRADNPNTEHFAWDVILPWCHSADESHRKIFGLIGASMARKRVLTDGALSLGFAIAKIEKGSENFNSARLKKILSCHDSVQLCYYLRPIIRQIESNKLNLCYEQLLNQLLFFDLYPDRQKKKWAKDCYKTRFSS